MKISAIIPAYNAERYLERAVNSLMQTNYPDLEVVIVEDGSTDATWAIAKRLKFTYPDVRLYRHKQCENRGETASRNLGLSNCTGDLVCLLDADDYVYPHRFDVSVSLLQSHPEIDAVHELAIMQFEGEREREKFYGSDDLFGVRATSTDEPAIAALLRGVCWPTSGILFRKKVLADTGLFPEGYRFAGDFHLWLRMACVANVVPGNTTTPVSVYFRHANNTFKGGLERKNDVIRAMTDVYRWLQDCPDSQISSSFFSKSVCDYIRNALIRTREEERFDIGRKIVRTVISNLFLPAIKDNQLLRQSIYALAGKSAPREC